MIPLLGIIVYFGIISFGVSPAHLWSWSFQDIPEYNGKFGVTVLYHSTYNLDLSVLNCESRCVNECGEGGHR